MRPAAAVPLALVLTLLLTGCGDTSLQPRATPTLVPATVEGSRSFAMGISSLPPELTEESYARTFELAGNLGEVILIQRTPPWEELLNGEISQQTVQTTQREKELAVEHGLDLFVAIDPTDSSQGRSEIAGLPGDLAEAGFANEDVRGAFLAYARYVAENYRPRYLALGVEINGYQHEHPQDFERFVTLYHEAYRAVKELSPETLVFTTFQFEELQGLLPLDQPYPPQWFLIRRFAPELDLLALSSYPSLVYASADEIPSGYFSQVEAYTNGPIAITGLGFASERAEGGNNENAQGVFLQQTLQEAERLQMSLVIWFAGQDPTFTGEPPFDKLAHIGLRRRDGAEKPAALVWIATLRRDLTPQAAPESGDG
jgi:hypothetical protein